MTDKSLCTSRCVKKLPFGSASVWHLTVAARDGLPCWVSSTSVSSSSDWGWQHGFIWLTYSVSKWLQGISGFHATPSLTESIKHATWYQHTSTQTRMITGAASSGDDCIHTCTQKHTPTTPNCLAKHSSALFPQLFTASVSNTWFTAVCL